MGNWISSIFYLLTMVSVITLSGCANTVKQPVAETDNKTNEKTLMYKQEIKRDFDNFLIKAKEIMDGGQK